MNLLPDYRYSSQAQFNSSNFKATNRYSFVYDKTT